MRVKAWRRSLISAVQTLLVNNVTAARSKRRALVTGGANGIGAAICEQLAQSGVHVTLCDRDHVNGSFIAEKVNGVFFPLDVDDSKGVDALFQSTEPFDVLINNVGADQHAFFTQTSESDWRHLLAVNLEAAFLFTRYALPMMQEAGFGRIVCVGSEAGRLGSKGGAIYAACKAGLVGFTRSIARENARFGVTANVVSPGPIKTQMVERGALEFGDRIIKNMEDLTLMKRLGRPNEVAAAVVFLASDEASYITGEVLGVSGGMGCGVS